MNYYMPRQRQSDGKWYYTKYNDNQKLTWPVGYCAEDCPGHDSPEEAREHFKQYELDHTLLFLDPPDEPDQLYKCEVCGRFTAGMAVVGGFHTWSLCYDHRNRTEVEKLYKVGDSFGSY